MAYRIFYTKSAYKDIKKLDVIIKRRIKKFIEKYYNSPLLKARKLSDPIIGTYRWRVGNYRIVFDLDDKKIVILRVRHRKEIYLRF